MPERLVTSVRVFERGGHDIVSVWNDGAFAGKLTVKKGHGAFIADRLIPESCVARKVEDEWGGWWEFVPGTEDG